MNLKEQLAEHQKRATELSKAGAERDLTAEELTEVKSLTDEIPRLAAKVKQADDDAALVKNLGTLGKAQEKAAEQEQNGDAPLTLGEHFVKHAGEQIKATRGVGGAVVTAPEWIPGAKAATDNQVTNGGAFSPVLTQIDRTIVRGNRPRLVVADLLGSGTMGQNTNAITYFVEAALEGAFTTVAEAGAKPQLHVVDPTTRTDALKKIAAFLKFSDEMGEDLDYWVSEINQRGMYELLRFEEQQLLNGNGSGTNVLGLLNRSGIQTEAAADNTDNEDAIFRAATKVNTGSGLDADGLIINPLDYQASRLRKDANGQYYGGGYFQPPYGENPGVKSLKQPIWDLPTVVTPAIAAGTCLVGALSQAATAYRKGGVRVESTNSHSTDFTSNLITTRIEERVALQVKVPPALVKVTLSSTPPA